MMIEVKSKENLKLLYSQKEIKYAVVRLAGQIDRDYHDRSILMIAVLKGAFIFLADLIREIKTPLTLDFIQVASYGQNTTPGEIRLIKDVEVPVYKRHVILIDDIIDTGRTTRFLLQRLRRRRPASLRVCTLLDKPSKREVKVPVHYTGFTVPNIFVVGYGIDFGERYRELPGIYGVVNDIKKDRIMVEREE